MDERREYREAGSTFQADVRSAKGDPTFAWEGLFVWTIVAAGLGAATAAAAFVSQTTLGFAPFLLFPAIAGGLLGILLASVRRFAQMDHDPTFFFGAILAAVVAVTGQHFLGFRQARLADREDTREMELARSAFPELRDRYYDASRGDFPGYLRHQIRAGRPVGKWFTLRGTAVWVSWAADAAILGISAWFGARVLTGWFPASRRLERRREHCMD